MIKILEHGTKQYQISPSVLKIDEMRLRPAREKV
jgi:hypothetical protein